MTGVFSKRFYLGFSLDLGEFARKHSAPKEFGKAQAQAMNRVSHGQLRSRSIYFLLYNRQSL